MTMESRDEIDKYGYDRFGYASGCRPTVSSGSRCKTRPAPRDRERPLSRLGEIMIGPPGLPKYGRRVFAFAAHKRSRSRQHQHAWKWVTGIYLAGVLAHFSHHMVGLPGGSSPSS